MTEVMSVENELPYATFTKGHWRRGPRESKERLYRRYGALPQALAGPRSPPGTANNDAVVKALTSVALQKVPCPYQVATTGISDEPRIRLKS